MCLLPVSRSARRLVVLVLDLKVATAPAFAVARAFGNDAHATLGGARM